MLDPGSFLASALLPLKRYAEIRGRSTRSELIAFSIVTIFAGVAIGLAVTLLVSFEWSARVTWAMNLALLCPFLALFVRRLHDSGRSAWWLLFALPHAGYGLWQDFHPEAAPGLDGPDEFQLVSSLSSLTLLVLLLWNDDPGANRYGPNPRFDAPEDSPDYPP